MVEAGRCRLASGKADDLKPASIGGLFLARRLLLRTLSLAARASGSIFPGRPPPCYRPVARLTIRPE
jgi:hypothetical protein